MVLFCVAPARGDDAAKPPSEASPPAPTRVDLALHPAEPPAAALKYRLTPDYLEQTPGNAATLYLRFTMRFHDQWARAMGMTMDNPESQNRFMQLSNQMEVWLRQPPSELPCDEVEQFLSHFDRSLDYAQAASRRVDCDWGHLLRESGNDVLSVEIYEFDALHGLDRIIALKARLRVAKGDFDGACSWLRTAYCHARHRSMAPFPVNKIFGMQLVGRVADQLEAMSQQPGAPNLYWTVAALPRPPVNIEDEIELDASMLYIEYPQFQEARRTGLTARQAQDLVDRVIARVRKRQTFMSHPEAETKAFEDWTDGLDPAEFVNRNYAEASKGLAAAGRNEQEITTMPAAQAVLLYTAMRYDQARDADQKWIYVPYWQAEKQAETEEKRLAEEIRKSEPLRLVCGLLPNSRILHYYLAHTERRLATLQVIEAIRFHAAKHDGKLPPSLEAITEVPVPINPVTGRAFPYQLDGDVAILKADGGPAKHAADQREYHIRIAPRRGIR
ncbi:MAG: hypothetical protein JW809_20175 [Pirellulales bacterium]|nr:hypothetical protein [Pirellulales bacterium]